MAKEKRGGLGRGLSALIPGPDIMEDTLGAGLEAGPEGDRILHLDPRAIRPNPKQPRLRFDEEALEELAESIKRDGVQEPIIVRRAGETYELVSGERRVRASVMADLPTIPAICRDVPDEDLLKLGLIENIQREDLNAIELGQAYERLMREYAWTQKDLSEQVGKRRATVANTLRLLKLPQFVQDSIVSGEISRGHAMALLALPGPKEQERVCRRIIEQGLSVRQVEQLVQPKQPKQKKAKAAPAKDPNIAGIEDELRRRLGTKVSLKPSGPATGKIEIEYFSLDDLDRILDALRGK